VHKGRDSTRCRCAMEAGATKRSLLYTCAMSLPDHERDLATPSEAARLLRLATAASVCTALVLIFAKLYAYQDTGAVSLLASLVDSLLDVLASLVNFLAVRYALKPADDKHRFGHGKAEALAALLQAAFIIASAAFLVYESTQRLMHPIPLTQVSTGVAVMLFSILVTAALVLLQRAVVRRTNSATIKADSLHYQADLFSNAATLAAVLLAYYGFTQADPLFGLLIAAYLLVSTREVLAQALDELLDRELPDAQRQAMIDVALEHPRVLGVHDVRTRRSGRMPIVQMHLEMNDELTLREAHTIADAVETAILRLHPGADVVIHQDPIGAQETQRWQDND
jgi:ferrous-iron efflux pump FieF